MTARMRWAIAGSTLALLLGAGALWFTLPCDTRKTPVKQEKATAELLLGKWKLVKSNATPPKEFQAPIEFTRDEKVIVWVENPLRNTPQTHGIYRLSGDTLWIFMNDYLRQPLGRRRVTIELITEDRLVAVAWAGEHERHIYEFERVQSETTSS